MKGNEMRDPLRDAVANLLRVKGRHHTEQAYKRLQEAYDAAQLAAAPVAAQVYESGCYTPRPAPAQGESKPDAYMVEPDDGCPTHLFFQRENADIIVERENVPATVVPLYRR